ncbi:MAG: tetratricopeptide repeat protein [Myxococcales bacterium]
MKKAVDASGGEDPDLLRQLGYAQLRSGQVDEAEAIAKKVNGLSPGDADTMALLAEVMIAKRQEETAVQLLDQAVEAHPNSARVRTARARYFFSRGRVNEALREFELAAEAAPEDTEIGLARARAMAASGQTAEAAELMGKIVAARPTDLNAQSSLAEVLLLADKVEEAQSVAKAVIDKQPKNGRALYVRARAIEVQSADDPVRAINAYQQAIEGDPNQTEALSRLWRLYLKQNQKNDAISMLERLRILGEATPDEDVELIGLYADTGINPVEGLKMCNEALKRDPGNGKLLGFKKQLEAKAPRLNRPKPGEAGGGIQVIKGGK